MVLNDRLLYEWGACGGVRPFDELLINPASMDLRMGNQIRTHHPIWDSLSREANEWLQRLGLLDRIPKWGEPQTFDTWLLHPGEFVLCHSLEFVHIPDDMIALLFSKSSTGRIGLEHLHAGLGDPGFHDAQWTWELHNVAKWPVPLVAGRRIMQQVLIRMVEQPGTTYAETGRYNGQTGPTPAKG
jgi:dCTP deaminase